MNLIYNTVLYHIVCYMTYTYCTSAWLTTIQKQQYCMVLYNIAQYNQILFVWCLCNVQYCILILSHIKEYFHLLWCIVPYVQDKSQWQYWRLVLICVVVYIVYCTVLYVILYFCLCNCMNQQHFYGWFKEFMLCLCICNWF